MNNVGDAGVACETVAKAVSIGGSALLLVVGICIFILSKMFRSEQVMFE